MSIDDFLKLFGKENLVNWCLDIPQFYIRPSLFFKRFFQKPESEKLSAVCFYSSLLVLLSFIFYYESIKDATKSVLIQIALIFSALLLLSLTRWFVYKIFKIHIALGNVFYFLILSKLLSAPIQVVFYAAFLKTEIYEFLFVHNLVFFLVLVFSFIYSNKILYGKIKVIIVASIFNLVWYNLIILIVSLFTFDKQKINPDILLTTDYIYEEYEKMIDSIDTLAKKMPQSKFIVFTNKSEVIVYTFQEDSIGSLTKNLSPYIADSYKFQAAAILAYKNLVKTADSFKYKRNRELSDTLVSYFQAMTKDIQSPVDSNTTFLIAKKQFRNSDSSRYVDFFQITIDPKITNRFIAYLTKETDFLRAARISSYPLQISTVVLTPIVYFLDS